MTTISLDLRQRGEPFVPYWHKCITAGRAAEGLRAEWRKQLQEVQHELHFEYIRFHGLFHEDMMVYRETNGQPLYNWQYIDSLFDFLLSLDLRPLVELSFMPYDLASGEAFVFWWRGNITPPKDYQRWAELVEAFIRHCSQRYGPDEVRRWYFEVWNEPNLKNLFWSGDQADYFKLYQVTANAIKSIDPRLRVGGPASSDSGGIKAPWVTEFLAFSAVNRLPVDFVSTHPYPNTWALDGDGNTCMGYRGPNSTLLDLQRVRADVNASAFPNAEIHLTEWNSSPSPRDLVHDTAFMAPFVVQNNLAGIGLVDSLGFWTFTDVFEENRAGDGIFHGGFGLINAQGLKKASYFGYWFLAKLGNEKLDSGSDYFISRNADQVQILLWNYAHYTQAFARGDRSLLEPLQRYSIFEDKAPLIFQLEIRGLTENCKQSEYTFDRSHGSVFDTWLECGAPDYPTTDEVKWLDKKATPDLKVTKLTGSEIFHYEINVQLHGVTLITFDL